MKSPHPSSSPSWIDVLRSDSDEDDADRRTITLQRAPPAGDSRGLDAHAFYGLSPSLLEKARRRLTGVGLGMAAVNLLGVPVALMFSAWQLLVLQALGILAGLGLALTTRSGLSHRDVLRLGLAFEIACAAFDSLGVPWFIYDQAGYVPVLTWTSLYIVLYPLIIPTPPAVTLRAALATAAMVPAGLLVLDSLGLIVAGPGTVLGASINPLLCVGIAVLASLTLHGINRQVAKAERLGSYLLEAKIGAGGMGEVWRARHSLLARPAAIKLIRSRGPESATTSDPGVRLARFREEARNTASLTSPHTIRLYDFGATEDDQLFFAMELLDGRDLEDLVLRYGPMEPARVARIMAQICSSLQEAHQRGLVHRDIKPGNIMLCRIGAEFDFVKVLDFGLATRSAALDEETETVAGTPGFLPPEAIQRGGVVDARSDLYSLGCTAYFLLTGRLVFEEASVGEMLRAHMERIPSPPSRFRPVPPDLERLILQCLAKAPEKRPASAAALAEALEATELPGEWTQARAMEWWSGVPSLGEAVDPSGETHALPDKSAGLPGSMA